MLHKIKWSLKISRGEGGPVTPRTPPVSAPACLECVTGRYGSMQHWWKANGRYSKTTCTVVNDHTVSFKHRIRQKQQGLTTGKDLWSLHMTWVLHVHGYMYMYVYMLRFYSIRTFRHCKLCVDSQVLGSNLYMYLWSTNKESFTFICHSNSCHWPRTQTQEWGCSGINLTSWSFTVCIPRATTIIYCHTLFLS